MTIIDLKEFINYNEEDILQFLEIESPRLIEIRIPVEFHEETGYPYQLDYFMAVYASQLLYGISAEFMHNYPCVHTEPYFAFMIITDHFDQLATHLAHLVKGYYDDEGDPAEFHIHVSETIDKWMEANVEFASTYFLEMIEKLG